MNKVMLIGNLTRDPELTTTNSGVSVCRFSLAVQIRISIQADFFNIVVWRGLGEKLSQIFEKRLKVLRFWQTSKFIL